MESIGESTLLISDGFAEEWEVCVDKKTFTLNEEQIEVVRKASQEGFRGMVWFSDKAISVPHISSLDLTYRGKEKVSKTITYEEVKDKDGRITSYRMKSK